MKTKTVTFKSNIDARAIGDWTLHVFFTGSGRIRYAYSSEQNNVKVPENPREWNELQPRQLLDKTGALYHDASQILAWLLVGGITITL